MMLLLLSHVLSTSRACVRVCVCVCVFVCVCVCEAVRRLCVNWLNVFVERVNVPCGLCTCMYSITETFSGRPRKLNFIIVPYWALGSARQ